MRAVLPIFANALKHFIFVINIRLMKDLSGKSSSCQLLAAIIMKRIYRHLIIGIILFALISCSTNQNKDLTKSESGNITNPLIDSLKSYGQEIQVTEIDPTKDNLIKGKNGTLLFVKANSLVDEKGVAITSKAVFELKEHFSISDFITSNLQTVHNNEILQTQGMIYFSAKTVNGTLVLVDKKKPIRIEIPVSEKIEDAKIFKGIRDENGIINWTDIEEPSKLLIPFPIKFISKNRTPTECCDYYGITKDTLKNKCLNYYDDIENYENTFIATREFNERFQYVCWDEVLKIYIKNINKNLWEADNEVLKFFIKDSIKSVDYELNNVPSGPNGGKRTKEQEEAHEWLVKNAKENGHWLIELYKKFVTQKLTKVDPTNKVSDSTIVNSKKAFMAYDALDFGWVNVDYFFKDPKAENIKLSAKTDIKVSLINLIIPSRKIILSGSSANDKEYLFTKNQDGYNKLPKGEKAIIFTMTIENNRLYFADKEIIIGQNQIETLSLKPTTGDIIKTKIKNYGN